MLAAEEALVRTYSPGQSARVGHIKLGRSLDAQVVFGSWRSERVKGSVNCGFQGRLVHYEGFVAFVEVL